MNKTDKFARIISTIFVPPSFTIIVFTHFADTPLLFGKYFVKTPNEIAGIDPGYIVWMWETMKKPPCTEELYVATRMDMDEEDSHSWEEMW